MATSSQDSMIIIWSVLTGESIKVLQTKLSLVTALKFSNSGKILFAGDELGTLYIYNIEGDTSHCVYKHMVVKKKPI